jgi:hypothetical protein
MDDCAWYGLCLHSGYAFRESGEPHEKASFGDTEFLVFTDPPAGIAGEAGRCPTLYLFPVLNPRLFIAAILLFPVLLSAQSVDSAARLFDLEKNVIIRNAGDARDYSQLRKLFISTKTDEGPDSSAVLKIVHLGDSHIQGDGFTGRIRQVLNHDVLRVGEGSVFPDKFGQSYGQNSVTGTVSGKWVVSQVMKGPFKEDVGITGYAYTLADTAGRLSFIWKDKSQGNAVREVELTLRTTSAAVELVPSADWKQRGVCSTVGDIRVYRFQSESGKDTFSVLFRNHHHATEPLHFLGIRNVFSGEDIRYQRAAVTGSQLLHWDRNAGFINELHRYTPDLLIISLGTNDAYNSAIRSTGFGQRMLDFIDTIRAWHPNCVLLFTTPPPSRGVNRSLERYEFVMEEMSVRLKQRDVLIYDLHSIVGGDTGIDVWNQNQLIARDLIHYKKDGYVLQADLFLLALADFVNLSEDKLLSMSIANIKRYRPGK